MNRIYVFVDGNNFYFGLKANNYQTRVNYYELSKVLAGPDRELARIFFYNSAYDAFLSPEQWKEQQPFLDFLNKTPQLELRLGRLVPQVGGGFKEKGTNVLMASDLVYYAARGLYDTAIVLTSDVFMAPALDHAKELGPHVEIGLFRGNQPRELVRLADWVIPLNDVFSMYQSKVFGKIQEEEDNFGNQIEDVAVAKKAPKKTVKKKVKSKV